MTRVVFWKNGDNDGCSFYRCDEPARALNESGTPLPAKPIPGTRGAFGLIRALSTKIMPDSVYRTADVIVGQRIAEDGPTELWRRLSTGELGVRPKLIYELDDDLLSVPESFGPVHDIYANPQRRANIGNNIARADVVTVTNEHLAERVRDIAPDTVDVRVIPNYVPERFVVSAPLPRWDGPLVIGWAGSGSHKEDFEQVIAPLRKVLRAYEVEVHLIGPDYAAPLRAAQEGVVRHTPWVDGVPAYLDALDFHVGIAPLVANLFNRSKSDIKLKEYAARGICPLASAVGPYKHYWSAYRAGAHVPHYGVNGALDSTWPEWLEALVTDEWLVNDGARGALKWARENTLEKHIGEWEQVITE